MEFLKETKKNIKFAWLYAKDMKKKIIGYTICNIVEIIISIITPIISASIIVNLTDNKLKQVVFVALILLLVEFSRNITNYISSFFAETTYREMFTKIQIELGKTVLKLTNECIDENSSGVFIQRLTGDTTEIASVFNFLNYRLTDLFSEIGIFVAIFIIDYRLFIYIFISIFLIGYLEQKRISNINEKDKKFRKENEKVTGFTGELVRGVRDIKMLSAEKSFIKELSTKLINLNNNRYNISKTRRNYNIIIGNIRDLSDFIMIALLVYLIHQKDLTIAMALVVHNYMKNASYFVNGYTYLLERLKDFNLSASRIFDIIHSKDFPKEKFGKKHIDNIKGNFEFKNVNFGYKEKNLILKDLSFKVKANQTVAFVGKSGVGKTTIFNLLCKMYNTNSGTITIDGEDIKNLDKDTIRNNITIISQNPYIFNLSIRDNLRLVKEDLTEEEMIKACEMACLDDFINALPDKYDTIVGEGGVTLSGGQRQRLAIARAFIQKTEIILFDEATSALDNVTQNKIQKAIENLQKKYTILIIAHRLSTIINSDKILFLDDGKVIASGNHEELLKSCPKYKKLYESEIEK